MNLEQAELAFKDIVRGRAIPWDALRAADATVAIYVLTQRDELHSLVAPWWVGPDGRRSRWDAPSARAVLITEQPLPAARQKEVTAIAKIFASFQPPVQVAALSYELPKGRQYLLDGTHRVGALAQGEQPFRLILVSIRGPYDGRYLPELLHFTTK